jgi:hypothetical protein
MHGETKDIEAVATLIEPGIAKAKAMPGDPLTNAVKANVQNSVKTLQASPP